MADLADVENALLGTVQLALMPSGTLLPSLGNPAIRLYRGWPVAAALDSDLAENVAHVTVVPKAHTSRLTTRWPVEVQAAATPCPLLASTSGQSVILSGACGSNVLAGVLVDQQTYVYRCQTGDTPALVAAALAAQSRAGSTASVSLTGSTLTFPFANRVLGRTAADYATTTEFRRQRQGFSVILWCPDPTNRDALGSAIDTIFAQTAFLLLADQTTGHLRYLSTISYDQTQDSSLYRRDLNYTVEYPTTGEATASSMLFGNLDFNSVNYFT